MKKTYYSMEANDQEANINIYGDITSDAGKSDWFGEEIDGMSSANLSKKLEALGDVSKINVYINSYGGEVSEGLAIYSALKRHKAKVITYCDGFAASIASVIFMAGDERVMSEASLLMIHNAWTMAIGNADDLRKQADDLEKITQASVNAYKSHSNLSEEEIKALMDAETWILPEEALEYGFATSIEKTETKKASQSVKHKLFELIKMHTNEASKDEDKAEDTDEVDEADEDSDNKTSNGKEPADELETDSEDNDEDNDEESDDEDEKNKPTEYFSGLFNAILKI